MIKKIFFYIFRVTYWAQKINFHLIIQQRHLLLSKLIESIVRPKRLACDKAAAGIANALPRRLRRLGGVRSSPKAYGA